MSRSKASGSSKKPEKPYPDFPLFPHATGRWAKKVRGRLVYFGPWADPQAALDKWLAEKDALLAGRKPRSAPGDAATVGDLVNAFLNAKRALVATGEITARRWSDLYGVCEKLVKVFGKGRLADDLDADDFGKLRASFAKTHSLTTLHTDLTRVRSIFNWGVAKALLTERNYRQMIELPKAMAIQRGKFDKPKRAFTQPELRALLDGAAQPIKAMTLLGINCGFGNNDVARLEQQHLDLAGGWIDMPRPKTGKARRAKLWAETVVAIEGALALRPAPRDKALANRVFITAKGLGWEARTKTPGNDPKNPQLGYEDNPLAKQFGKLLNACKVRRGGIGFYTLRRMFETIGGGSLDQVAVDHIMGHSARASDMAAIYRLHIDDSRLEAVAKHVHRWLWPPKSKARKKASKVKKRAIGE